MACLQNRGYAETFEKGFYLDDLIVVGDPGGESWPSIPPPLSDWELSFAAELYFLKEDREAFSRRFIRGEGWYTGASLDTIKNKEKIALASNHRQ